MGQSMMSAAPGSVTLRAACYRPSWRERATSCTCTLLAFCVAKGSWRARPQVHPASSHSTVSPNPVSSTL